MNMRVYTAQANLVRTAGHECNESTAGCDGSGFSSGHYCTYRGERDGGAESDNVNEGDEGNEGSGGNEGAEGNAGNELR